MPVCLRQLRDQESHSRGKYSDTSAVEEMLKVSRGLQPSLRKRLLLRDPVEPNKIQ